MKTGLIFLLAIAPCLLQAQNKITLDQYLDAVHSKDPSFRSAQLMQEGANNTADTASLLTTVNFFSSYSNLYDARPVVTPAAQGDLTRNESWAVGLKQQTPLGLQWSLSQNYSYTKISNASLIPVPEYYDAYPKLEMSLPLWRNLFGSETRANRGQLESQMRLQKINADVNMITKESEIKEAFYNLATQQKNYEIQKDSLERAEKILSWAQTRVSRNLSDKSDLYQTQALVASRNLDLMGADNKLKEAARLYNSFLGIDSENVPQSLLADEIDLKQLILKREQQKSRLDLLLQKESIASQEKNYLAQKEKNKPNLDLSFSYAKYGRDTTSSAAQGNTFRENKDYYLAALVFSVPLDLGTSSDAREGYEQLAMSQSLAERVRQRTEGLEWKKAVDQAASLAEQLKIVRELEVIQKSKADLERSKFNNGRSTTYQVLTFEQDYMNSRNSRINLELQLRKFINSLELYKN